MKHGFSVEARDFDLAKTLDSGQVFHWEARGDGFVGTIGDCALHIQQHGDELLVHGGSAQLVRHYFALDHSLGEICAAFPDDPALQDATNFCRGLRIMRQPIWECLASFITSSMKQVAHIRQMSRALRERFGEPHVIDGHSLHAFPSAEAVAQRPERELRDCALGYRAKNLLLTAERVSSGEAEL